MTKIRDLYWLAGLLEGEGSFCKPMPSSPNKVIIALQMTDEDVISKAAKILGCNYYSAKPQKSHHKATFILRLRGGRAVEWMNKLHPLLGKRRQKQIDEALAKYDPDKRKKYLALCKNYKILSDSRVVRKVQENMQKGSYLRTEARRIGVHPESLRRAIARLEKTGSSDVLRK